MVPIPRDRGLIVRHALTLGTEWDELTIPYTDPRNSEIAMDQAKDRYATCWNDRSSAHRVSAGPTMAEPLLC